MLQRVDIDIIPCRQPELDETCAPRLVERSMNRGPRLAESPGDHVRAHPAPRRPPDDLQIAVRQRPVLTEHRLPRAAVVAHEQRPDRLRGPAVPSSQQLCRSVERQPLLAVHGRGLLDQP